MSTWVARLPRDVIVVNGADTLSYLQSLISQDIDALAEGDGAHSLLLTPQGKLDVDFVILRIADMAWLVCERGFGEQLKASLQRFKIRVAVELTQPEDFDHLGVRGAEAVGISERAGLDVPAAPYAHREWRGARVVRIPWPGGDGVDVIGPKASVAEAQEAVEQAGAGTASEDEYEAARVQAGVPRQGVDFDEKTIPQEAFLERDAVSFAKGCFLGQELVCRIDTRGHVNRYLRSLRVVEGDRPPRGAEIVAGDRIVGTVTSTVEQRDLPSVALGYVRREVELPADVVLRWDGRETRAVVEALESAR